MYLLRVPGIRAVTGFLGVNHCSLMARKCLGTAPGEPGNSPEFTTPLTEGHVTSTCPSIKQLPRLLMTGGYCG